MKKFIFLLVVLLFIYNGYCQDSYKTESGIVYKIGDTLRIGSPLSHLGWRSVYRKKTNKYMSNKNLIKKDVLIVGVDTKIDPVILIFEYKRTKFKVEIDDALRNKEVIPPLERELINKGFSNKYQLLKQLKDLLDIGAITEYEYKVEKKKILQSN
ncbi:MAG: hypothetical protein L3J09_10150 [Flavobacteriaceae bacterium]|nr:hypothetical protein [Flavobacteriaceae bacterium]